jgi:hypothetical protein
MSKRFRGTRQRGRGETLTISRLYHLALKRCNTVASSLSGGISKFKTYAFHLSSPSKSKVLKRHQTTYQSQIAQGEVQATSKLKVPFPQVTILIDLCIFQIIYYHRLDRKRC